MLAWIIGFSVLGSVASVAVAGLFLLLPERTRAGVIPSLISYATGTLLGAAFLGMIPAGLNGAPAVAVTTTVLGGIVLFFVLEKLVLWRHCHDSECEVHGRAAPLPGAVAAYLWLGETREAVPYILALSAASFIYIAAADLIPGLHRQVTPAAPARQIVLLLAGIGTIAIFRFGH